MPDMRLRQTQGLADMADMLDELRHLLVLVFWAAQAQGQNGGPFAVAANMALAIVDRQTECLKTIRDAQVSGGDAL